MLRKLDKILNGINREKRPSPREDLHQATDGDGASSYAGTQPRGQEQILSLIIGRDSGQPRRGRVGRTQSLRRRMPTMPQVRSVPDLNTVSQYTTMYASMFKPLNRSLETFITKLSKSTERGENSRRTLEKPKAYKGESDGCIDTWIDGMKLHFEGDNLSKKQECSAVTRNLEATALICVMAKKTDEQDIARKIFDILLNRFGSAVQGHRSLKRGVKEMTNP